MSKITRTHEYFFLTFHVAHSTPTKMPLRKIYMEVRGK
uniref:Uncharacterized protein n=1 Tax=Rhizophora mucronata TaxID=61149 RepID=A0A2P2NJZ6_RHIMU